MGVLLQALDRLLPDPSPALVFEIGERAVVGARCAGQTILARAERDLPGLESGEPSDNSLDGLTEAVPDLLGELEPLPSPHAAVLLPDHQTRLAVFEFDRLPRKANDLRNAVERRFRNSLPFESQFARIAFRVQASADPPSVLATAASAPYVRRCEQAFEEAGLIPGYVGAASAAALNLVEDQGTALLLKLAGESMTMAAIEDGTARLVRRIALPADLAAGTDRALREILADLFPTLAYIEENLGTIVSSLRLAGRGELFRAALEALPSELAIPVLPVQHGTGGELTCDAGLLGFIHA